MSKDTSNQAQTWKTPPSYVWRSEDGMESVLVFPDGSLEISCGGKGMGITPRAIIEKMWGRRTPMSDRTDEEVARSVAVQIFGEWAQDHEYGDRKDRARAKGQHNAKLHATTELVLSHLRQKELQTARRIVDKLFYGVSEWAEDRDGDPHRLQSQKNTVLNESIEAIRTHFGIKEAHDEQG